MRQESALPGSWPEASALAEFRWENRYRTIETQFSFAPEKQAGQFFQRSGNNKWMSVTFELTFRVVQNRAAQARVRLLLQRACERRRHGPSILNNRRRRYGAVQKFLILACQRESAS